MILFKSLRSKILVTFLICQLVVSGLAISIFSVIVVDFSQDSADDCADEMRQEELLNMDRLAVDNGARVDEYFKQVESDIRIIANYAEDLFDNQIDIGYFDTYYSNNTMDPVPPGYVERDPDPDNDRYISLQASTWYLPGVDDLSDTAQVDNETWALVNLSANLDSIFKSIWYANPAYSNIYMGFEEGGNEGGLFRTYPYENIDSFSDEAIMSSLDNCSIDCPSSQKGKPMKYFDPRCRSWYQDARRADELIFTEPYPDAGGLGLMITAAMPVKNQTDGSLIGVVAADLTLRELERSVLGLTVIEQGYAFVQDSSGKAIIHKDIDHNATNQSLKIQDLEFQDVEEGNEYDREYTNDRIKQYSNGSGSFKKSKGLWFLSWARIETTNYTIVLVVTEDPDIIGVSNAIHSEILSELHSQQLIFLLAILCVTSFVVGLAIYTSQRIVQPVEELTEVADLIASGKLDQRLKGGSTQSKEIQLLYNNFHGLIAALLCGNDDYYSGKIHLAMDNYLTGLELFTTLDNQKGIAMCHNNIGNIQHAKGDIDKAKASYEKAIEIGKEHMATAGVEEMSNLKAALASRYNNLSHLYMDQEDYENSEKYLRMSLDYDREIENTSGLVTRYGNLGVLFLTMDKTNEAKEVFEEGFSIAEASNNDRAKACATMYMGIWEEANDNHQEAITRFTEAAQLARNIDVRILRNCLQKLRVIHKEKGDKTELAKVRQELDQFKVEQPKDVMFVIDHSDAMKGKKIQGVMKGLNDILEKCINPKDRLALMSFAEKVDEHLPLIQKEGNEESIKRTINKMIPSGRTAFYDALGHAVELLSKLKDASERWLFVLTDGDDGVSMKHSPMSIKELIASNTDIHIIIIGIGNLITGDILEQLCESSANARFIDRSHETSGKKGVAAAFEEIVNILTETDEVASIVMEVDVEGIISSGLGGDEDVQ